MIPEPASRHGLIHHVSDPSITYRPGTDPPRYHRLISCTSFRMQDKSQLTVARWDAVTRVAWKMLASHNFTTERRAHGACCVSSTDPDVSRLRTATDPLPEYYQSDAKLNELVTHVGRTIRRKALTMSPLAGDGPWEPSSVVYDECDCKCHIPKLLGCGFIQRT